MPYAQRYKVTPAVIPEIADRLATAFEKIIRGSGPLSKELAGFNLTKSNRTALIFLSGIISVNALTRLCVK